MEASDKKGRVYGVKALTVNQKKAKRFCTQIADSRTVVAFLYGMFNSDVDSISSAFYELFPENGDYVIDKKTNAKATEQLFRKMAFLFREIADELENGKVFFSARDKEKK